MLYFLIPADLVRASRKLNTDNPKQSHTQGIWEIIKKRLQGYVLQIIPRSSTCRMDMQIYKIHLVVYKKSRFWDRSRLLLDTQISAGSQLIGWINTDVLYEVRSLTKIIDQPGRYYWGYLLRLLTNQKEDPKKIQRSHMSRGTWKKLHLQEVPWNYTELYYDTDSSV